MELQSWGLRRTRPSRTWSPNNRFEARKALAAGMAGPWAVFAQGRSYSDVALAREGGASVLTGGLTNIVSFDRVSGVMCVEAGVSLREIQAVSLAAGWGLPVLPGTSLASAGGALANDVHGKNHENQGSFSQCVESVEMFRSDRGLFVLDRADSALWAATVGGLGATGLMLTLTLRLRRWPSAWVEFSQRRFVGMDEFLAISTSTKEFVVGWVDALSSPARGIVFSGEVSAQGLAPKQVEGRPSAMPPLPTVRAINSMATRLFNKAYWWAHPNEDGKMAPWAQFFCPLDNIAQWNRLYGPRGFSQFQCVVPEREAAAAFDEIFRLCRRAQQGSFLSVIKRFGPRPSEGILSFCRPGITFAMDFPNQPGAAELIEKLSRVALDAGGALYPAKMDLASMSDFERSFPAWEAWRSQWDPVAGSCSTKWLDRLGLR